VLPYLGDGRAPLGVYCEHTPHQVATLLGYIALPSGEG
jgi:hypothetical protein